MCTVSATGAKVGVTHTADRHAADRLAHAPNSGTRTWGAPRPSVLARPPVASHQIGGGTASVLARGVHEARAPSNARPPWRCKTPDREAAARTFAPAPPSARCSLVLGCSSWRPLSPPSGASAVPRFWNLPRRAGLRAFSPPSVVWKKEALSTHCGLPTNPARFVESSKHQHGADPRVSWRRAEGRRGLRKSGEAGDRRWDG